MGGGGSETSSKSSTTYGSPISYMPTETQSAVSKSLTSMAGLPASIPLSYGGTQYDMSTMGPVRAASALQGLYSPVPVSQVSKTDSATGPTMQCCFNFLEAEGEVSFLVKQLRDETISPNSLLVKGYKISARWFVPLMRQYRLFKWFIKYCMTRPITRCVEWHYGTNRYGWIYAPLGYFWKLFWVVIGKYSHGLEYTWREFYADRVGRQREWT